MLVNTAVEMVLADALYARQAVGQSSNFWWRVGAKSAATLCAQTSLVTVQGAPVFELA